MERSLYYVRLFPGTEERYDRLHAEIPSDVSDEMREAGLRDVTGFRRGTDVWWYALCEPDRATAFRAYAMGLANRRWGKRFRDVIAEVEAPNGGLIWYDEVFHTDAPAPELHMIGISPPTIANTVIIFGRTRSAAPAMMALRSDSSLCGSSDSRILRRAWCRYTSITTPVSAETPASAMNPTPTATLKS